MGQRDMRLDPAHLRLPQPEQITYGIASSRRHWINRSDLLQPLNWQ